MHTLSVEEARRVRRRVVAAGIIGNVMEWYDFAVYGYFARTIATLYFPTENQTASLLAAFGVFAAGFLMRPVGAVLFGFIGDRVGRGPSLLWSVVVMAVPTFAIGLLPTYAQIGVWASLLMLICRILQGLAVGGEFTGSAVFLAETARPDRRGAASAWAPFGAVAGILLGSAVGAVILNALALEEVVAWAWRLPFLFGVVVGAVGFLIRRRLPFDQPAARKGFPLAHALRDHPIELLQVAGISLINAVGFYTIFVYIVTWLRLFADLKASVALQINSFSMAVMLVVILGAARLSDLIGRKPVLVAAAAGLVLFSWPLMALMRSGEIGSVLLGQLGFAFFIGSYVGVNPIAMCEIFPRFVRCSAVSTAYNVTLGALGGTAPMIATWLIAETNYPLAPALYVMLAAALSMIAALSIRSNSKRAMDERVSPMATAALGTSGR